MASRNGREFIVTYSAEGDFLRAGIRIEAPNTVLRNEGDRERPVLSADVQRYRSVGVATQAVHLLVFLNEQLSVDFILGFITGRGQFGRPAQDVFDRLLIVALHSLEKGLTCLRGRLERRLRRLLSQTGGCALSCPQRQDRERNHCGPSASRRLLNPRVNPICHSCRFSFHGFITSFELSPAPASAVEAAAAPAVET